MTPEEIFEWILDMVGGIFPTISITAIIVIVVLGLIIPLIVSIWIAYDASRDPKSVKSGKTSNIGMGIIWFLLSFFLNFFFIIWIIYLFYRTPSGEREGKKKKKRKD